MLAFVACGNFSKKWQECSVKTRCPGSKIDFLFQIFCQFSFLFQIFWMLKPSLTDFISQVLIPVIAMISFHCQTKDTKNDILNQRGDPKGMLYLLWMDQSFSWIHVSTILTTGYETKGHAIRRGCQLVGLSYAYSTTRWAIDMVFFITINYLPILPK